MAGLPWFAVYSDFSGHPKTARLCDLLGDQNAGMHVVRLLAFCASYAADGRVPADMVIHAAGKPSKRGADITAALLESGFVRRSGDIYEVHGWDERNGAHARKREKDARKPRGNKPQSPAGPARDGSGTGEGPALERERERENEKKKGSVGEGAFVTAPPAPPPEPEPPPANPRAAGEAARLAAPSAETLADLPATTAVLRALHAAGKLSAGPAREPRTRRRDEELITATGIETATARILAAWNPARPTLGWYSDAIAGTTPKPRGMAAPSNDHSSLEATTL